MFLVGKYCKKKILKVSMLSVVVLITLYCVMLLININRTFTLRKPIFTFASEIQDYDNYAKQIYKGLGFKVEIETTENNQIISATMTMFNKVIAGATTEYSDEQKEKRYAEIIDSLEKAIKWQIGSTFVIRNEYNCTHYGDNVLSTSDLISNGYLKQEEMLDIDNKSYCKGSVYTYMGDNCNVEYNIFISCKDYKTPGFIEHSDLEWEKNNPDLIPNGSNPY
jgi:hypothetical protein